MRNIRIYILVAVLLLSSAITLAVKYWPHTLRDEECSLIYQRYADDPGVEASFVKGLQVSDSLVIDATLLRARDSAAWERLREDFEVSPRDKKTPFSSKRNSITVRLAKKGETKQVTDTNLLNNDYIAFSGSEKCIAIYHITDSAQWHACLDYFCSTINN